MTVHIMYDPLVFFTDDEFQQTHPGTSTSIQAEVEQPEIYLLSWLILCRRPGSTRWGENQLLDGPDNTYPNRGRSNCEGHPMPAAQFEQGSKQGGTYNIVVARNSHLVIELGLHACAPFAKTSKVLCHSALPTLVYVDI